MIYATFEINRLQGATCKIFANFQYEDGSPIKDDQDGKFDSKQGNVVTGSEFTPRYAQSRFSNFRLFIPLEELEVSTTAGAVSLKFYLSLESGERVLATTPAYEFILK